MARPIPTQAYEAVLEAIARFPEGASIEQIEENLAAPPNRRTLQRWLNDLIAQERVHREGQGRAVKYRHGKIVDATAHTPAKTIADDISAFGGAAADRGMF